MTVILFSLLFLTRTADIPQKGAIVQYRAGILKLLWSPGIDAASLCSLCWNFRTIYGARNRVRIRLSYRPAGIHRLAETIPWNRFLGSFIVHKFGLRKRAEIRTGIRTWTWAGKRDSEHVAN
jgi:hypothetical protein